MWRRITVWMLVCGMLTFGVPLSDVSGQLPPGETMQGSDPDPAVPLEDVVRQVVEEGEILTEQQVVEENVEAQQDVVTEETGAEGDGIPEDTVDTDAEAVVEDPGSGTEDPVIPGGGEPVNPADNYVLNNNDMEDGFTLSLTVVEFDPATNQGIICAGADTNDDGVISGDFEEFCAEFFVNSGQITLNTYPSQIVIGEMQYEDGGYKANFFDPLAVLQALLAEGEAELDSFESDGNEVEISFGGDGPFLCTFRAWFGYGRGRWSNFNPGDWNPGDVRINVRIAGRRVAGVWVPAHNANLVMDDGNQWREFTITNNCEDGVCLVEIQGWTSFGYFWADGDVDDPENYIWPWDDDLPVLGNYWYDDGRESWYVMAPDDTGTVIRPMEIMFGDEDDWYWSNWYPEQTVLEIYDLDGNHIGNCYNCDTPDEWVMWWWEGELEVYVEPPDVTEPPTGGTGTLPPPTENPPTNPPTGPVFLYYTYVDDFSDVRTGEWWQSSFGNYWVSYADDMIYDENGNPIGFVNAEGYHIIP